MTKKNPIALIDMDRTIFDYAGAFIKDLKKISTDEEIELIDSYNGSMSKICSHHLFEQRRHIITSQYGWWRNLPVMTDNLNFVRRIYEMGFDIHILTKGPESKPFAWSEKFECIKENLKFDVQMNIVTDKSLFYGNVLFDDHVPYVLDWLEHRSRGIAILPRNIDNENEIKERNLESDQILLTPSKNEGFAEINYRLLDLRNKFLERQH